MTINSNRVRSITSSKPKDDFARLGDAFLARLQSDRVQFVTLSAALAIAEDEPQSIFEDLRFRAHRLNGAAAIFEAADVMHAADALEQAAVGAKNSAAKNTDAAVWETLQALVTLLGRIEDSSEALSA